MAASPRWTNRVIQSTAEAPVRVLERHRARAARERRELLDRRRPADVAGERRRLIAERRRQIAGGDNRLDGARERAIGVIAIASTFAALIARTASATDAASATVTGAVSSRLATGCAASVPPAATHASIASIVSSPRT